jgi:O-antigen/teichoic acid export membrane protein
VSNETPTRPAAANDVARARAGRHRALRWGAATGVAARVISVGCTLATVPIALRALGVEGYGLWMTMASLATLLSLLDFGVGLGVRNLLARTFSLNEVAAMRAIWAAAIRRLALIGFVLAVAGVTAAFQFDWAAIFNVQDPRLAAQLPSGLAILAIGSGVALPFSLSPSFAAALQRPWLTNICTALGGAALLAGVFIAATTGASLPAWVAIIVGLPVLINAGLAFHLHRALGWSLGSVAFSAGPWPPELRRLSFWFFVPQAGSLFAQAAPAMLIAFIAGPEPVATFNLLQRIFGLIGQVHWMVVAAWWPAYAEAEAQRDFAWIRAGHRWSWWVTAGGFVPAVVVAALLVPWVIQLWVGNSAVQPAATLVWLMAAWQVLQLLGQPPALLLNGLGRIKGVAIYSTIGHAASLVGMLWLGEKMGIQGVIWGMMLGFAAIGLPGALLDAGRQLRKLDRA